MAEFYRQYKKGIDKWLALILFVAFTFLFFKYVFSYIAPFAFAFLLALMLEPLVKILTARLKMRRGLAGFICIVLLLFMIVFIGIGLVNKISEEAVQFAKSVPVYFSELEKIIDGLSEKYADWFSVLPPQISATLDSFITSVTDFATGIVSSGVKRGSTNVLRTIPSALMGTILCLISTFFMLKDKELIKETFVNNLPPVIIEKYGIIKRGTLHALNGYIRSQLTIMSITATITIIGLLLMGYPYALFLGLIIALVDALPVFGGGFILWPWITISLIAGNFGRAVALIVLYVVIFITRQVVEPRILGNNLGIHPIATLMAIYIGLRLFGILGLIIGPVIVVIAISFFAGNDDE